MHFVGREKELESLRRQYASNRFEFTVIYGRRRVGKTYLIQKYIRDKNALYYMAMESNPVSNLEALSNVVNRRENSARAPFASFEALFTYIGELAAEERFIFVIDEYPYLAAAMPELSSILQRFIDHDWKQSRLHFILCGSSMSFMERQVLGAKSPLYGRRTSQLRISPFNWFETETYLERLDRESAAVLHVATGGIAEYLSFVDPASTLKENLLRLFMDESGRLFDEPSNLLKQELREPRVYNDILDAIARGATKHNEIATQAKLQSGALTRYLDALMDLGIVIREQPLGSSSSRKAIYRIQDGCFRFWYRFVKPNLSAIALSLGDQVYDRAVASELSGFMGQGFEQICYDIFDRMNQKGELPDLILQRGRWWGNNPSQRVEEEVDLLGVGQNLTIFGEMKWNHAKLGMSVIHRLEEKSLLIPAKERCYIFFSKTGFTPEALHYAQQKGMNCVTFL